MAADERPWIEVVDWDKLQHYRDRNPPWIKDHVSLLDDDVYTALTEHRALLFHRLRLAYASADRRLRLDTRSLSRRLALRVTVADIEALSDAGFVRLVASAPASTPLVLARARARSRSETETETLNPTPSVGTELRCRVCGHPVKSRSACAHCGASPRAAGSNPRAATERARDALHEQLLARAWEVAAEWNGGGSDLFDERLDELERRHGGKLSATERMRVWDGAQNHL